MNAPQLWLPSGAAEWHPAVRGRRMNEGLTVALAGLACVGIALGIALAMPKPNYPLVIGGIVGLLALTALVTSPRLELTVGGLVFFLGCLNGPLKLLSSTGRVGSGIQDVLIIAIVLGMAIRHLYQRQAVEIAAAVGPCDRVRGGRGTRGLQPENAQHPEGRGGVPGAAPVRALLHLRLAARAHEDAAAQDADPDRGDRAGQRHRGDLPNPPEPEAGRRLG